MASKNAAKQRRTNLILFACGILLIALKLLSGPWPEAAAGRFANAGIGSAVTGNAAGLTQEELERRAREGMITMTMNPDPVFETGDSAGNLLIENAETNSHTIVVEILRRDTEEVIYTSGLIPVGMYVNEDKLAVDLPAGDYDCVAYFHYVDEETGDVLGSGGVTIAIHILN